MISSTALNRLLPGTESEFLISALSTHHVLHLTAPEKSSAAKMQDSTHMNYVNLQPERSTTATFPHLKNIDARFFIRVLLKSLSAKEELLVLAKVPELNRRTSCCLATLINAYAVLCTFKAKPEAPAEDDAA